MNFWYGDRTELFDIINDESIAAGIASDVVILEEEINYLYHNKRALKKEDISYGPKGVWTPDLPVMSRSLYQAKLWAHHFTLSNNSLYKGFD